MRNSPNTLVGPIAADQKIVERVARAIRDTPEAAGEFVEHMQVKPSLPYDMAEAFAKAAIAAVHLTTSATSFEGLQELITAFEAVDKATSDIRMKMPMFADYDNHIRFCLPLEVAQPFGRASADFCQKLADAKKAIAAISPSEAA